MNNPLGVFPAKVYATDQGSWASSPELARKIWMRIRDGKNWYAVDMEITSPSSIQLCVYDMHDNVSGGIGKKIFETPITEFKPDEQILLDAAILQLYSEAATQEYCRRDKVLKQEKILQIRKEFFGI